MFDLFRSVHLTVFFLLSFFLTAVFSFLAIDNKCWLFLKIF